MTEPATIIDMPQAATPDTRALELGSIVTMHDHLIRVRLSSDQVAVWVEHWPLFPAGVATSARTFEAKHIEYDRLRPWARRPEYKVWLPASLLEESWRHGLTFIRDTRRHPAPWLLPMPKAGVIIQQINLQDGRPFREEYGAEWDSSDCRIGFRVAYDLHRRPLTVLPSMIDLRPAVEEVEAA